MSNIFKSSIAFAISLAISACGGGSSSDKPATPVVPPQPTNTAPTITVENVAVNENTPVTITATASDVDGDELTYSWSQISGDTITFTENGSSISFDAPEIAVNSEFVFEVTVSDGSLTTKASSTLTVNNVNQAPTVSVENITSDENTPVTVAAFASDADGDTLTYSWTQTSGDSISFAQNSSSISFTAPNVAQDTEYSFEVAVSDGLVSVSDIIVVSVIDTGMTRDEEINAQIERYDNALNLLVDNYETYFSKAHWITAYDVDLANDGKSDVLINRDFDKTEPMTSLLLKYSENGYIIENTLINSVISRAVINEDLNNDGLDDIYMPAHGREWSKDGFDEQYHQIGVENGIWLQNGSGGLSDAEHPFESHYTHGGCATDFTGDGFTDLVENNLYYQHQQVLVNNGDETFSKVENGFPTEYTWPTAMCLGIDANGDGFGDALFSITHGPNDVLPEGINGNGYLLLFGDGEKLVFDEKKSLFSSAVETNSWNRGGIFLSIIDYNGDSCEDFVSFNNDGQYFAEFEVWQGNCAENVEYSLVYSYVPESMKNIPKPEDFAGDVFPDDYQPPESALHLSTGTSIGVADLNDDGLDDFYTWEENMHYTFRNGSFGFINNGQGGYDLVTLTKEMGARMPLAHYLGLCFSDSGENVRGCHSTSGRYEPTRDY